MCNHFSNYTCRVKNFSLIQKTLKMYCNVTQKLLIYQLKIIKNIKVKSKKSNIEKLEFLCLTIFD